MDHINQISVFFFFFVKNDDDVHKKTLQFTFELIDEKLDFFIIIFVHLHVL